MQSLIKTIKDTIRERDHLPFSVYTSIKEQQIFNVPMIKPLLIFVLGGCKKLGEEKICPAGSFIFLSNSPNIDMRNIPYGNEYFALLIEFEYTDFECLPRQSSKTEMYFQGAIDKVIENTLQQFVEWSAFAPPDIWAIRRQEILQLLFHLGYQQVSTAAEPPSLSHKLYKMISLDITNDLNVVTLSSMLAMSESTLRRKLSAEGTNLQAIKDKAKLGRGLYLIQTTLDPIGLIAEQCGYHSQSRFTDKFKQLFGMTPTELRKTKMHD